MKKNHLLIALSCVTMLSLTACSSGNQPKTLEITSVSEFQEITAPDSVTLSVAVNSPDLVQSYQWQIVESEIQDQDGKFVEYSWLDLTGSSAATDTLVLPGADPCHYGNIYRCIITDKNGNELVSEETGYKVLNANQSAKYIMLGELTVKAGETIDLSTTPYGSGTISLNEDGDHAVMKDLKFDNTKAVYDIELASQGFCFCDYNTPIEEFTLEVQGDCSILNTMYQEDYHTGGIPVLFNCLGQESAFNLARITGDGTLSIKGGQALIYSDVDLEVDCDLVFDSFEDHFTDGIRVKANTYVHDCSIRSEKLNGRVVFSNYGNAVIENCIIDTDINVPAVAAGAATYRCITGYTGMSILKSDINMRAVIDGEWLPNGLGTALGLDCESGVFIEDSNINIDFRTVNENENLYNFVGIYGGECLDISDSDITVTADTPIIGNATGLSTTGLTVTDSTVNIDVLASASVYGIADNGTSSIRNSSVAVKAANADLYEYSEVYGMMVYGLELTDRSSVQLSADSYPAFGLFLGSGDNELPYDTEYSPTDVLSGVVIEKPEGYTVNQYSVDNGYNYIYLETVYESGITDTPADQVVLKAK